MPGRVLIIDDEANLRQTLTRILRQDDREVTAAADGPEALRRLAAAEYDLTYLDVHLPGMDGLQVLSEIHRLYPDMPVVLFTAHGTLQSAVEALRLGATDYLLKPVDPKTLLARTEALLGERAVQRRRREIQQQIEKLQAELRALEQTPASPVPEAAPPSGDRFFELGRLILDLHARRAILDEVALDLPPAAFDYLVVLARRAPEVVDYQTLVAEAQGYQTDRLQARELAKWHIHQLREALEPDAQRPRRVLNVRGAGYRLIID